mmetsp:Transcript_4055/g.9212  ORF Transcript_4055/g.9212 Transcript_4055/m.9212 type:complete len:500 (+) Transcript_4055:1424-2923(+)
MVSLEREGIVVRRMRTPIAFRMRQPVTYFLCVIVAEIITGYLSRQYANTTEPSTFTRFGGAKGKSLYDFFVRSPDDDDEPRPEDMRAHLDPRVGPIGDEVASGLVNIAMACMKKIPSRRPHLDTIINALQEIQDEESKFEVANLLLFQGEGGGVPCDRCCTRHNVCYECDNPSSHRICARCIYSQYLKVAENSDIVCPIDNCRHPFEGMKLIQALGETRYNDYVLYRAYLGKWRETVAKVVREVVSEEWLSSNTEILQGLDANNISNQVERREIREMLVDLRTRLKSLENKAERAEVFFKFLAAGESILCPKLIWMVPNPTGEQPDLASFFKKPFKCNRKIFFVCERSYCLANPETPIEMALDRRWLKRVAPLLKASVVLLKVVGTSTNIPLFNSIADAISSYTDNVMEDPELESITDIMDELGVFKAIENFVDDGKDSDGSSLADEDVAMIERLAGESHRFLAEEAQKPPNLLKWARFMEVDVVGKRVVWVANCRKSR